MHLRGAGIGKADIDPTPDQRPHQTFRTVHRFTPVSAFFKPVQDQSFLRRFVKGFAGIAAIAATEVAFFNRNARKSDPHALVACEFAPIVALLANELAVLQGIRWFGLWQS
jgi:hypothetical protein